MRKGKIAAQASHASMSFLTNAIRYTPDEEGNFLEPASAPAVRSLFLDEEAAAWVDGAFTKIVVYVNSEEELLAVHAAAKAAGCRSALIQDAGRTEFHGVPTYTCVGIGPNLIEKVNRAAGHLPLL